MHPTQSNALANGNIGQAMPLPTDAINAVPVTAASRGANVGNATLQSQQIICTSKPVPWYLMPVHSSHSYHHGMPIACNGNQPIRILYLSSLVD